MIFYFNADTCAGAHYPNDCIAATGMPVHVRQSLLHDPKDGDFRISREPAKYLVHLQIRRDSAPLGKPSRIPVKSRLKAAFVKQGRMHQVRYRAHLADDLVGNHSR